MAMATARRRPSESLATGICATTTATALASSNRPIRRGSMPICSRAYGGTIQVKTPQPTPISATFVNASRTKGRSRSSSR